MRPKRGDPLRLFPPDGQVPPEPSHKVATSTEKAHGRIEKRTLRVTTVLTKTQAWASLKQGFELIRERTQNGKTTKEIAHGITSLTPQEANAQRLLELTRDHSGIENGLQGEDQSRIRKGVAPQVMAALRNSIVHILCTAVAPNLTAALPTMNNCFSQALSLLDITQSE